jgi:diguanylate cyclase (GGDEF)-like protein
MEGMSKILVIDDEQGIRDMLSYALGMHKYHVISSSCGEDGIKRIKEEGCDLAILDMKMPGPSGIEILAQIKAIDPDIEVIVATGFGTIETAVDSMKRGAFSYINKPFDIDELLILVQKALERKGFKRAYSTLDIARQKLEESNNFIEGVIESMTDILLVIDLVGKIIKTNRAFSHFFMPKDKPTELWKPEGREIAEFLPIAHIFGDRFPEHYSLNTPISNIEIVCTSNENISLPLSLSAAPVYDTFGGIRGSVIILRDISLQKEAEKNLKYLASHDLLTELPNRVLLNDRVQQAISRAARYNQTVAILLLDLDRFKEVNDTLGHDAGDRLLKEASCRLKTCLREYDTVARMGGDEFVLAISEMKHLDEVNVIANRILSAFNSPILISDWDFHITTSIGISLFPNDGDNLDVLLKNADIAMYTAKKRGGNNVCFYTQSMGKASEENINIKNNLIQAVENSEFELYYQPLIDTESGKIVSTEALIRWIHPTEGIIAPLRFIPIAESTGLITQIGRWVLRSACEQCMRWQEKGFEGIPVSVNISTRQLYDESLTRTIFEVLEETGLPPQYLILEITESSAMQSIETAIRVIDILRERGIRIFLDDFGSGYSSFSWLKVLPVQAIKIDRYFIQHVTDDPFDAAIVQAIVFMAHSLDIIVIAEGVENIAQLEFLRSIKYSSNESTKCDEVQGFLFSKPIPAKDFERLLVSQKK